MTFTSNDGKTDVFGTLELTPRSKTQIVPEKIGSHQEQKHFFLKKEDVFPVDKL